MEKIKTKGGKKSEQHARNCKQIGKKKLLHLKKQAQVMNRKEKEVMD